MSIVINSNPGSYYSAHGDLLFVVYESVKANDPVTYPDYKYVADIYIGATMVARLKSVPQPDNKRGIFNIGNVIRNYISATFNSSSGIRSQQLGSGEFNITATVKFGEEYGFNLYTNLTVDSARIYYNHYNGRMLGVNTSLAAFTDKLATNRPLVSSVNSSDNNLFIPYFPTSTSSVTITTKTYNDAGLINTYTDSFTPAAAGTLQQFNVGPGPINAVHAGAINANVKYYTVQAGSGAIYRFNLTCEAVYENKIIHFLNQYGGWESKDFSKVSRKSVDIDKQEFAKLPYTIDGSGNVSYYNSNNVYNDTRSIYSTQYTEKMTLNTDILSDEEYTWLADLVLSPMTFMEMGNYFVPCYVTAKNYEYKKRVNDKLTNLQVEVEFGDQFNAQYR